MVSAIKNVLIAENVAIYLVQDLRKADVSSWALRSISEILRNACGWQNYVEMRKSWFSWRGSKKNLLVRNQKDVYHLKYNNVFNENYGHIDRIHASI